MSQVDACPPAPVVNVSSPDNNATGSSAAKKNQKQQQNRNQGTQQPKSSKNTNYTPKGTKNKGLKATAAPPQPYYQELIMQLTNASEWTQCHSKAVQEAQEKAYNKNDCSGSVIATTTTTTTTLLQVPETRPEPHRRPSSRSTKSFQSALSFQTAKSTKSPESSQTSIKSTSSDSQISLSSIPPLNPRKTSVRRPKSHGNIISLADMHATSSLHALLEEYGGVQHGGILDPAYSFFVNEAHTAAISFIVKDKVAVVGGDPLCSPRLFDAVFAEFAAYRKRHGLGVAIFGGSDELVRYGKSKGWSSIRFGQERVLNPITNPVLHGKAQKQIIRQNKALLDPARGGNTLNIYAPATTGRDLPLERSLSSVYDAWKDAKNTSGAPQRYTTVYDPFALPELMIYIYTREKNGTPNGFAALRKLGAKQGYYIDPCIAAPGAPSRIPDLLYFTAMGLLNMLGCGYLAIGMEPASQLELSGFPKKFCELARRAHGSMFESLKLQGKKEYHSKFRPDDELGSGLHLMFPGGAPGPRRILSVVHFANISLREIARERWQEHQTKKRAEKVAKMDKANEEEKSETEGGDEFTDGDTS